MRLDALHAPHAQSLRKESALPRGEHVIPWLDCTLHADVEQPEPMQTVTLDDPLITGAHDDRAQAHVRISDQPDETGGGVHLDDFTHHTIRGNDRRADGQPLALSLVDEEDAVPLRRIAGHHARHHGAERGVFFTEAHERAQPRILRLQGFSVEHGLGEGRDRVTEGFVLSAETRVVRKVSDRNDQVGQHSERDAEQRQRRGEQDPLDHQPCHPQTKDPRQAPSPLHISSFVETVASLQ